MKRLNLTGESRLPSHRGLTLYCLLALASVALLCLLGQVLIQRDLELQALDLRRIEVATQKAGLVPRWLHEGLPTADLRMPALASAESDVASRELHESARRVLSTMDGAQGDDAEMAAWRYQSLLEQISSHLHQRAQGRIAYLRFTELGVFLIIVAVLVAEGLLVFRPLINQLEQARSLLGQRLRALRDSHEVIKADLRAAAAVQQSLLPRETPKIPGLACAWSFKASHDVAGDMFHLIRLDEYRLGIYLLDVSGHGVPAALLSVSLSRAINANLGELLRRRSGEIVSPAHVAAELNRRFPVMSESDQFFTFMYGVLDMTAHSFTFVQAGHPGPIVVAANQARTYETPADPPIGIFDEVEEFSEIRLQLREGDMLFFYTDGIAEAQNCDGAFFGLERLTEVLTRTSGRGVSHCIEETYQQVRRFTEGLPQKDDMTLVGLELTSAPAVPMPQFPARNSNAAANLVTASGRHRSPRLIVPSP